MRKLVVTEKFSTALRIATLLSQGKMNRERRGPAAIFRFPREDGEYTVTSLRGHIVELDYPGDLSHWTLESLPRLLEAEPVRSVTEPEIVTTLKSLALENDQVILATDWDREGEVIAAECLEILHEANPALESRRAQYSALTRTDIERAFSELKDLDTNLAAAGMARQNVDLMWGALLTRYLTLATRVSPAGVGQRSSVLSVGRVQTPTLALLVKRDQAIHSFQPKPFWEIFVTASSKDGGTFTLKHAHGRWFEKGEAEAAHAKIQRAGTGVVQDFAEEEARVRPPIPFSTTLFLAEATHQGFGAAQAMRLAEDLYTQGIISYPRTDNTVYPASLRPRNILSMLKEGPLSKEANYCLAQESIRPTRGRRETTDHPPIYPTAILDMKRGRGEAARLYELVARRFLATVAPDAVGTKRMGEIEAGGEKLIAEGLRLSDRGWYSVYPYLQPRESDVPRLDKGEKVKVEAVELREGRTEPPRRYSQGSLIQEMERLGLGTKSTRHEIVQKLFERRYVIPRGLEPTTSGLALIEALEANAALVTRPEMTSRLEEDMNTIAKGEKALGDVVTESREMLREVYGQLVKHSDGVKSAIRGALDKQHYAGPCPQCGGHLRLFASQGGKRWIQCLNNPLTCKASYPLPPSGHIEPTAELCPRCRVPLVRIVHRGQQPLNSCVNPACEAHQDIYRIGTCPSCKSPLHIKHSFRGKRFVACTNFPQCRVSYPLPQRGRLDKHAVPCETCAAPIVTIVETGRRPWTFCINLECPNRRQSNIGASTLPESKGKDNEKPLRVRRGTREKKTTSKARGHRSPADVPRTGNGGENAPPVG